MHQQTSGTMDGGEEVCLPLADQFPVLYLALDYERAVGKDGAHSEDTSDSGGKNDNVP